MPMVHAGRAKDDILAETGHTVGLRDIDLEIERGEIFVVMGLSGSGKSTLIRHFNRLIEPTEGAIFLDGVDVLGLPQRDLQDLRRHRMSMVFQRFALFPHRTVLENAAYGLAVQDVPVAERDERARDWLRTVGLEGYEDQYPVQLSGGEQQRVGLARALCTDPEILLMDEAFSALDPLIRSGLQEQLLDLHDTLGKTIVFITHDLDEALRIGDRIAILKDGALSQVGRPAEILLDPADDYVEAFVRDVNRARVLTVGAIMGSAFGRLTADSIGGALSEMDADSMGHAYVFDGESYCGGVTRAALERAREDTPHATLRDIADGGPSLRPDIVLQDALPATLQSDWPVPVIGGGGEWLGVVSRDDMVGALTPRAAHRFARGTSTER